MSIYFNKLKHILCFLHFYKMELNVNLENKKHNKFDKIQMHKMVLLYNALDNGWSVYKKNDSYIFSKNHEGKKEVFVDSYLIDFIKYNMNLK